MSKTSSSAKSRGDIFSEAKLAKDISEGVRSKDISSGSKLKDTTNLNPPVVENKFSYNSTRNLGTWLERMKTTFVISSYKSGSLFFISSYRNDVIHLSASRIERPMGICFNKEDSSMHVASIGNIFKFQNMGPEKVVPEIVEEGEEDNEVGYDASFYPRSVVLCGDTDLHDLKMVGDTPYYVSSLFNCVCKTSDASSFAVHWVPPWITRNALGELSQEDRCHLNGLCCVDGVPKYVTSASMTDEIGGWREKSKNKTGVVWDIVSNKLVCSGLSHPHSPKWDSESGKLWILNSGTGQVGWVDVNSDDPSTSFHPVKFVPGFLRGSAIHGSGKDKVITVCTSLDRHDSAFDHIELGSILKTKDVESKCGIWVLNINTLDVVGTITFKGIAELYDIIAIPFIYPSHYTVNSKCLLTRFHIEYPKDVIDSKSGNGVITVDETETLS